jgi:molecular chaperone HtpG
MEAFKARNIEVLFLYEPVDDYVMQHLAEFEGKKLLPAQDAKIDLESIDSQAQGEALDADAVKGLCTWLQESLGSEKVSSVQEGQRLIDSPVLALVPEGGMNAQMRRMMEAMGNGNMPAQAVTLEINPRHALIHKLASLKDSNGELAKLMAEQLLDSALVNADMLDNPRNMVTRMHELLSHIG